MIKQPPIQNKFLQPLDTLVDKTATQQQKHVPWEWGVKQGVQLKKIRSSTGFFNKLSADILGSVTNISGGTINTSQFNNGTIVNSSFQGTVSQPVTSGGTFTNPLVNTGTFNTSLFQNGTVNGGTIKNTVLGTPQIAGGTLNPDVYQTGGTAGIGTVIKYVVSVSPGTVLGTLTFSNGLLILSQ